MYMYKEYSQATLTMIVENFMCSVENSMEISVCLFVLIATSENSCQSVCEIQLH